MIYVTRRERFSSAHRLFREEWTDSKNNETFGACSNPNWHGHNYELIITVKGEIDPMTGFVINLKTLSNIIKYQVVEKFDHKNINIEVDFMQKQIASSENIAVAIWNVLYPRIAEHRCTLHKVKLIETENNYVEYYG